MKADLRFERTFPHPPQKVWDALANRDALAAWLMPNDFEPRVGHKFNFRTNPVPEGNFDGIVHCKVLECDPPRKLSYTWAGGGISTVVTWTLTVTDGETHLLMEHTGFEGPRAEFVSNILREGWTKMIQDSILAVIEGRDPKACESHA